MVYDIGTEGGQIGESYARLFSGVTAALEALQKQDYIKTKYILIKAIQDAEDFNWKDGEHETNDF